MKKNFDLWVCSHPNLKKLIMELKIAFLIILVSVSSVFSISSYSQGAKVSLDFQGSTIERVMDEIELQRAVLPYLRVQDDAGPTDFYMTPRYTGEGWYLMDLQCVRTGNNIEIAFLSSCAYGTIIIDNVRIE